MKFNQHSLVMIVFFIIMVTACGKKQEEKSGQPLSGEAKMESIDDPAPFPIPGRPDNLTQADVDKLLANGEMNFDGFRFDKKRMDFINFAKGSFRGTTFFNSVLNDGIARRKSPEPDKLDFEDANFYLSNLKRVNFSNWKFLRTVFQGDSITEGVFKNCAFTDSKFYNSKIIEVKFNNGLKTSFNNVGFFTCNFNGGGFDSIRFVGGAFFPLTKFTSVNFNVVEFNQSNFAKNTLGGVKFTAGSRFNNVKFISATLDGVVFGDPVTPMGFENVVFDNTSWRNGTVSISFNTTCIIRGATAVVQNINFGSSVFNNITFGVQNANYKLPVKQCNFTGCTFNGTAVFYNCNLEGSTFPPNTVLQAAGVKFINCLNAPYNTL